MEIVIDFHCTGKADNFIRNFMGQLTRIYNALYKMQCSVNTHTAERIIDSNDCMSSTEDTDDYEILLLEQFGAHRNYSLWLKRICFLIEMHRTWWQWHCITTLDHFYLKV